MPEGSYSCLETPIGGSRTAKHNPRPDCRHERFPLKWRGPHPGRARYSMLSYLLRRIWQMIPTLAGGILLVFFLFKFFGGDPAEIIAGLQSSAKQVESIRRQLGLDRPMLEQLWSFVV